MEIIKDIEIKDLCLYLKKEKTLILADSHIGYEEALNKQGVLVPRFQFKEIIQRLEKTLKSLEIETIIINGDIKHEFGTISETEWRHTLRLLDFLKKYCSKIILIKGNHDTILGPIAEKRGIEVKDFHKIGDLFILHGHKIPKLAGKTIIIAHEHPAVSLAKGPRTETYKCFLLGKYKGKNLIVQPSLNLVTEGTDILKEELLSPFLHQNLNNFNVFIVSDKVYDFGKVRGLKNVQKT